MKYSDIIQLTEAKSAPLYHATGLENAVRIINTNVLQARTDHKINGKDIRGTSLTRSLAFAKTFENIADLSRIIFVLDQQKITQSHRIVPIDFFDYYDKNHPDTKRRRGEYAESEEFLIGDLKNFDRYLTKIIITKECAKFNEENLAFIEQGRMRPHAREIAEEYLIIKNHPKTVFEK